LQAENTPARGRALMAQTLQHPHMFSPREISAAIKIATEQNGSLTREELPVAVARLFGFQRTGNDFKAVILGVFDEITASK
ncbi:MAG: hypothetical protein ACKVON_11020, partial [Beijerinckiaceae bacterium]